MEGRVHESVGAKVGLQAQRAELGGARHLGEPAQVVERQHVRVAQVLVRVQRQAQQALPEHRQQVDGQRHVWAQRDAQQLQRDTQRSGWVSWQGTAFYSGLGRSLKHLQGISVYSTSYYN